MNTLIALAAVIIALPGAIIELNKLIPATRRRQLIGTVADYVDCDNTKKIGNSLVYIATIGMLITGFVVSYCFARAVKFSHLGLYVGLFSFALFAWFALYIFENCKWK